MNPTLARQDVEAIVAKAAVPAATDIPQPAFKPVRVAALKRPGEEEEVLRDAPAPEAGFQDVIVQDEGAALEAIAPAPAPESGGFLDTLLAQAGTGTGTGAAVVGSGIPPGVIAGGALLFAAAASGGGGGGGAPAPAPAPSAPNQLASINASAPQRTGYVYVDAYDGDQPYMNTTSGQAALVIVDPDGGDDLKFREPTAEQLQGKYGTFTFNADTGEWTYTIDPTSVELASLDGTGMETLEVFSNDGTASTVIEVEVWNDGSALAGPDRTLTIDEGGFAVIDLSAVAGRDTKLLYDSYYSSFDGEANIYAAGGFALIWAGMDVGGNFAYTVETNKVLYPEYPGATPYYSEYEDDIVEVEVNLTENEAAPAGDAYFDFYGNADGDLVVTEGESLAFGADFFEFYDESEGGEIFTLVLDAANYWDNLYDDLGTFSLAAQDGLEILGNGTSQVAIRGTATALDAYANSGKIIFTASGDNDNFGDGEIVMSLFDSRGGEDTRDYVDVDINGVNDAPTITVGQPWTKYPWWSDGDFTLVPHAAPTIYVPSEADGFYLMDQAWFNVYLGDEEALMEESTVTLTLSVNQGSLGGLDGDGSYTYDFADGEVTITGAIWDVQSALHDLNYTGTGGGTLTMTLSDGEDSTTKTITLRPMGENAAPAITVSGGDFADFALKAETIPASMAAMTFDTTPDVEASVGTLNVKEDQHLSLTGLHLSDADAGAGDVVYVSFYAYAYQMSGDDKQMWGFGGAFYLDPGYDGVTVMLLDDGQMALGGTMADINAAFDAGAVHYALPPDWEGGNLSLDVTVFDGISYEGGAAQLQIELNVEGTNDVPVVLGEAQRNVYSGEAADAVHLQDAYFLADGNVVYDAEYHAWHGRPDAWTDELDIEDFLQVTAVTVVSGGGSVVKDTSEDGGWIYTPPADAEFGDTVQLAYTFTDGTTTLQNTLELSIYNNNS